MSVIDAKLLIEQPAPPWAEEHMRAQHAKIEQAAAFLDGLADTFDSWSVFAGPAYDCRAMAAKLRGKE